MGQWSLARDPSRNGHKVLQDLWHFTWNALDGTEDDKLYTEEGQEIDNDEDNEFETESEGESDVDGE